MAPQPTVDEILRGYQRARRTLRELIEAASDADLARRSAGTRWTNQQLLFHMLFGYLVTRNLLVLVKLVARLPKPVGRGFAALLNAGTRPFDQVNYWGSRAAGQVLGPVRTARWMDRVVTSLQRHLERETPRSLERTMAFPTRWDPYFKAEMTLRDVYDYPTLHFDHHRRQLTLGRG
jgi:hypothetical protein